MLDRYWWGAVNRISPEAPVPVVNLEKISITAGGAANVAANVAGLGAKPFLVGVIGDDEDLNSMIDILNEKNVTAEFLVKSKERRTTVKTRILAHNQQIVRVDKETKADLSLIEEDKIWKAAVNLIDQCQIIIMSDYAKGVITESLSKRLITHCNIKEKIVLVDPKGKSYLKYSGATLITPNRFEVAEACQLADFTQPLIEESGSKLLNDLSLKYLLVTQGEEGMTLFERDKETIHIPVELRNVYDVTGAGDTVIASLAVAMGGGVDFTEAAKFANRAAGLVVEQIGTTSISIEMLNQRKCS
jgi:D-beta-D-heptose 7-phosphate kinase/D-beta-D-heptose 1-phosphate adenosyltransferase